MGTSAPQSSSSSSSSSLLVRARSKDRVAWQRLVKLYGPLTYRWARQAGLQDGDASDVVQDVFGRVSAKLDEFQGQGQSAFRGWLWTITRNMIVDHVRRRASQPQALGGADAHQMIQQIPDTPFEDSASSEPFDADASLLHRALEMIRGDFEDHTWQAFWRLTVGNESAAEIGDDLKMTKKAVRQAKYRVLSRLRGEFGELL